MGVWDATWPIVAALLPSIGLLYLFWVIMKHILEGDRRERAAQRLWEAERDASSAPIEVADEDGDGKQQA